MTSTDKVGYEGQRKSERVWPRGPLTTGTAIALLGANVLVMLLTTLHLAHRLDQLDMDVDVGSISANL